MKSKIISCIIILIITISLVGCTQKNTAKKHSINKPEIVYSSNTRTALLIFDDETNKEELANAIDTIIHTGYMFIANGITNPSSNAHNRMENYIIFSKPVEK